MIASQQREWKYANIVNLVWFLYFLMSYSLGNIIGFNHYITTIMLLFISLFSREWQLKIRRWSLPMLWYYGLFFLWTALSWLWAEKSSETQKTIIISMVEICVLLACMLNYVHNREEKLRSLLLIFTDATAAFAVIYYLSSPISTWGTEKMGGFTPIWRNAAGYYFGFAGLFALYFSTGKDCNTKSEKWRLLFEGFFLILAAVGTGSRKVFVQIALAGILYLVFQKGVKRKLKIFLGAIVMLVFVVVIGFQIPAFQDFFESKVLSMLGGTSSSNSSTIVRAFMRQYAIELFWNHPVIGVGLNGFAGWMGNNSDFMRRWNMSATYSHCNYTELLANSGLIGFALYYTYPVILIWKKRKSFYSPYVRLGLITIISFIILDYGTISYYMRFYLFIFFCGMICLHIESDGKKVYPM